MFAFFAIIGLVLVQGSTILQIIKFIQTKKTDGVSIGFWWAIFYGLSCYLVYSISIHNIIYTISNTIGILLTSFSLGLYYYYRRIK